MSAEDIEIQLFGDEEIRVLWNSNVKMSRGKMAAQAITEVKPGTLTAGARIERPS